MVYTARLSFFIDEVSQAGMWRNIDPAFYLPGKWE
jgi:hypothetical protein